MCEGTLREHLSENLGKFFRDVFVAMTHSVQIVPAVEYCERWALEHAMWYVLLRIAETPQLTIDTQQSSALL